MTHTAHSIAEMLEEAASCRQWFCVQAKANQEKIAAENLKDQGYEVFLPQHQVKRRHARRVDVVSRPLFRGYCFVAFDPAVTQWRSINGTRGVIRLMMYGETPAPVPAWIIDDIKSRLVGGFVKLDVQTFQTGQRIRINDGPLNGQSGIFHADLDDDSRVSVLLNILGRQVRMAVPIELVEAA